MRGEEHLAVLRDSWHGCNRCRLADLREGDQIVFGDGPAPADIMLIGSHPTENDEGHGTPFTGDEGEMLVKLLTETGIDPEECYRSYIVACRPKVYIPTTAEEDERIETVAPNKEDYEGSYDKKEKVWLTQGCNSRLHAQIYAVDPRLIITFGPVPLKMLKARDANGKLPRKISEAQRALFEIYIPGRMPGSTIRYPVIAALDMGYIIRNPVTAEHGPLYIVMEALRRARTYVDWVKKQEGVAS